MTNHGQTPITPHHLQATPAQFLGRDAHPRYVLLPGSDGRARQIASRLENVSTALNDRQLNCYFGELTRAGQTVDVAVVSSGMGSASMDIVIGELLALGARWFLRLGTAGSLQPEVLKFGDLAIATAAVRDEGTTLRYAPIEVPALADPNIIEALQAAAHAAKVRSSSGLVHCKDNLHAREFGAGPMHRENQRYMEILKDCGVLASEMETAALFLRCQLAQHNHRRQGTWHLRPRAGALLAIIGDSEPFAERDPTAVTESLIETGLNAVVHYCQQNPV